jgi:hypothetical protein
MEKSLSVGAIADRMETVSVTDSDGGASSDYRVRGACMWFVK